MVFSLVDYSRTFLVCKRKGIQWSTWSSPRWWWVVCRRILSFSHSDIMTTASAVPIATKGASLLKATLSEVQLILAGSAKIVSKKSFWTPWCVFIWCWLETLSQTAVFYIPIQDVFVCLLVDNAHHLPVVAPQDLNVIYWHVLWSANPQWEY